MNRNQTSSNADSKVRKYKDSLSEHCGQDATCKAFLNISVIQEIKSFVFGSLVP